MLPRAAEVVIVGAGAIGCSVAYHLSRRGLGNVLVLERRTIGSGSTSKAAGGVRAQFGTEVEVRFSLESIAFFERFEEEMGVPCDYRQVGYLFLVSGEAQLTRFRRNVALQQRLGVPVRIVTPDDVRALVPELRTDDLLAGVWCPIDGYATPNDVVQAYAARARERGVRILEETEVTGIRVVGDRVEGVETSRGFVSTRLVVNAAGPNAGPVARLAGGEVPVVPKRRHIFVTAPFDGIRHPTPMVIDTGSGFYFRSEQQSILLSAGDVGAVEDYTEAQVDWSVLEEAVRKAVHRVPALERADVRSAWAGLRPLTPDEHAIVDWLPGVEGVLLAVGFGGHGFQHSPAAGRVVAELILDGRPSLDIGDLRLGRFARGDRAAGGAGPQAAEPD